eukprot:9085424-Alexandrium_andersonii.AAC.1
MSASLVGSEMCIRDSSRTLAAAGEPHQAPLQELRRQLEVSPVVAREHRACLLYTSDAADDM